MSRQQYLHPAIYNVDWVYSEFSTVHVANHAAWFTTLDRTQSEIYTGLGSTMKVYGVGVVELETNVFDSVRGVVTRGAIMLHDVLYVPEYICNILGGPIKHQYHVNFDGPPTLMGLRHPHTLESAGMFDMPSLAKLMLPGQVRGQTSFHHVSVMVVAADWLDEERAAFREHRIATWHGYSMFSREEWLWINTIFGNLANLHARYDLKMHDEGDKAEMRAIVRELMASGQWPLPMNGTAVH